MCQSKPFLCFLYNETITYRERHDNMDIHYNDPNQYLVCRKCKVSKYISQFRFKDSICRLCLNLSRYRFDHTRERFIEHVKKYNIEI